MAEEVLRNLTNEFLIITKNGLFVNRINPIEISEISENSEFAMKFNLNNHAEVEEAIRISTLLEFELKKIIIHEIKTKKVVDFKGDLSNEKTR